MVFAIGDVVQVGAEKALGAKIAKQRYGSNCKSKLLVESVLELQGESRSRKYLVRFNEISETKSFSARSLQRHLAPADVVDEAPQNEAPLAIEGPAVAVEEPLQQPSQIATEIATQPVSVLVMPVAPPTVPADPHMLVNGVQWSISEGVTEDWRLQEKFKRNCCGETTYPVRLEHHWTTGISCFLLKFGLKS